MADSIGGQQRQGQFARDLQRRLIARLFFAAEMPLQFHIYVVVTEKTAKLQDALRRLLHPSLAERMRQGTFFAAGQADQSRSASGELLRANPAFAFLRVQLHMRDQAAEVLISGAALHEHRVAPSGRCRDLRAHMRLERELIGGQMKTRGAIHAVAIHERHGPHAVFGADRRRVPREWKRLRES